MGVAAQSRDLLLAEEDTLMFIWTLTFFTLAVPPTRLSQNSNICSTNVTDGTGRWPYLLSERDEPVRSSRHPFSLTQGSLTIMEVTYYEPIIVDRLNSAPGGRTA